jgi:hypothetical protein
VPISGIRSLGFDLVFTYKFRVCFRLFPTGKVGPASSHHAAHFTSHKISRRFQKKKKFLDGKPKTVASSIKKNVAQREGVPALI